MPVRQHDGEEDERGRDAEEVDSAWTEVDDDRGGEEGGEERGDKDAVPDERDERRALLEPTLADPLRVCRLGEEVDAKDKREANDEARSGGLRREVGDGAEDEECGHRGGEQRNDVRRLVPAAQREEVTQHTDDALQRGRRERDRFERLHAARAHATNFAK